MLANMQVNMHEAKTKLSNLVERAMRGEEIIIARDGKAAVQLMPVERRPLRPIGLRQHMGMSQSSIKESVAPLTDDEIELWENPNE
jgi:prevent-host-death family protein